MSGRFVSREGCMSEVIPVYWRHLDDASDGWRQLRCLYAYFAPDGELLYIGKAWGKTVLQRWRRDAKADFWDDLEQRRRIFEHSVAVGTIALEPQQRLTRYLLSDIESLLIHQSQPWGNIQCRSSRIIRPGLVVQCRGDWILQRRIYRDAA